jgi:peroxiredoxin
MEAVTKANAVVLGVSRDNIDSHSQFICKLNLLFTLLSAPAAIAEAHPVEVLES